MAIYYTDVASNQIQGVNFPGQSGLGMMTPQPGVQNNPILEGPSKITANIHGPVTKLNTTLSTLLSYLLVQ